jgi:hypothetical protein
MKAKAVELLERTVLPDKVAIAPDESRNVLNIAGVYQDRVTWDWAAEACHLATQLAGEGHVQNRLFNADSLSDPEIFADAVRAALTADVIVVSVYAADRLPPNLYVWFEAWLPLRPSRAGALTAMIGVTELLDSQSVRTFEYLYALARKGQLDFIPQERQRPIAFPTSSLERIAEPAGAAAQAFQKLYGPHYDAYYQTRGRR